MSIFSSIDAENHRYVVQQAIEKAKAQLDDPALCQWPTIPLMYTKQDVEKLLDGVLQYCERNIFE